MFGKDREVWSTWPLVAQNEDQIYAESHSGVFNSEQLPLLKLQ